MGYYIRVLAPDASVLKEDELRSALPSIPQCELVVTEGDDGGWSTVILRHPDETEIAILERNPVTPSALGDAEIGEFLEEAKVGQPKSAGVWLEQYLKRIRVIYAFQLLQGTDVADGWHAVHALQSYIWNKRGGILQSDGEGFTNEDGYHILWQFSEDVEGSWNMAILDGSGQWIRFEMDLGNREHRAAFLEGKLPKNAKVL